MEASSKKYSSEDSGSSNLNTVPCKLGRDEDISERIKPSTRCSEHNSSQFGQELIGNSKHDIEETPPISDYQIQSQNDLSTLCTASSPGLTDDIKSIEERRGNHNDLTESKSRENWDLKATENNIHNCHLSKCLDFVHKCENKTKKKKTLLTPLKVIIKDLKELPACKLNLLLAGLIISDEIRQKLKNSRSVCKSFLNPSGKIVKTNSNKTVQFNTFKTAKVLLYNILDIPKSKFVETFKGVKVSYQFVKLMHNRHYKNILSLRQKEKIITKSANHRSKPPPLATKSPHEKEVATLRRKDACQKKAFSSPFIEKKVERGERPKATMKRAPTSQNARDHIEYCTNKAAKRKSENDLRLKKKDVLDHLKDDRSHKNASSHSPKPKDSDHNSKKSSNSVKTLCENILDYKNLKGSDGSEEKNKISLMKNSTCHFSKSQNSLAASNPNETPKSSNEEATTKEFSLHNGIKQMDAEKAVSRSSLKSKQSEQQIGTTIEEMNKRILTLYSKLKSQINPHQFQINSNVIMMPDPPVQMISQNMCESTTLEQNVLYKMDLDLFLKSKVS